MEERSDSSMTQTLTQHI